MIRVAVIGSGHWGPNLVRNFCDADRSAVTWVADRNPERLTQVERHFGKVHGVKTTQDAQEVMRDPQVDAVVVATPTVSHYELVKESLLQGKHVLVEKPLADTTARAGDLVSLAEKAGKVLLVGHVFIYNPAVEWVKRCIDEEELGRLFYVSSQRTNLGPIRMDVNAAWDLASQDLSVFDYWLGGHAKSVSAVGGNWINPPLDDVVFATLRYPDDIIAHVHVSWLNPRKIRDITVVGERQMLTCDDMNLTEPIRVYDKQVTNETVTSGFVDSFAAFRCSIHEGDIHVPRIPSGEPLRRECEHFLDCVEGKSEPKTGGEFALNVVRVLEAMTRSIENRGLEVEVQ